MRQERAFSFNNERAGLWTYSLDAWVLDAWTLNALTVGLWTPFFMTSIYFLMLYNVEFAHITNGLLLCIMALLNVLLMTVIIRTCCY